MARPCSAALSAAGALVASVLVGACGWNLMTSGPTDGAAFDAMTDTRALADTVRTETTTADIGDDTARVDAPLADAPALDAPAPDAPGLDAPARDVSDRTDTPTACVPMCAPGVCAVADGCGGFC